MPRIAPPPQVVVPSPVVYVPPADAPAWIAQPDGSRLVPPALVPVVEAAVGEVLGMQARIDLALRDQRLVDQQRLDDYGSQWEAEADRRLAAARVGWQWWQVAVVAGSVGLAVGGVVGAGLAYSASQGRVTVVK